MPAVSLRRERRSERDREESMRGGGGGGTRHRGASPWHQRCPVGPVGGAGTPRLALEGPTGRIDLNKLDADDDRLPARPRRLPARHRRRPRPRPCPRPPAGCQPAAITELAADRLTAWSLRRAAATERRRRRRLATLAAQGRGRLQTNQSSLRALLIILPEL